MASVMPYSGDAPPAKVRASSRSGSIASLWSSADVPFFLDARRSNDAGRKGSLGSMRRASDHASTCPRTAGSPFSGSHVELIASDSPTGFSDYRDLPVGPTSPRPSVESAMSSPLLSTSHPRGDYACIDTLANRASLSSGEVLPSAIKSPDFPTTEFMCKSDSQQSFLRGFQSRKPLALQIQPVAYSSPLSARVSSNQPMDSTGRTSPATSTIAPSLGKSPVPSQETDTSADLPTPMTTRSSPGNRLQELTAQCEQGSPVAEIGPAQGARHSSLYARADQFFRSDYSMATMPMTAHDFRACAGPGGPLRPSSAQNEEATNAALRPMGGLDTYYRDLRDGSTPAGHTQRVPQNSPPGRGPVSQTLSGRPGTANGSSQQLEAPISLDHRRVVTQPPQADPSTQWQYVAAQPSWLNASIQPNTTSREVSAAGEARQRTMSTPRLHAAWLADGHQAQAATRKSSFCVGTDFVTMSGRPGQTSPASRLMQLRLGGGSTSSATSSRHFSDDNTSASTLSSSLEPPVSPQSSRRLLRQVSRASRLGTPSGTSVASVRSQDIAPSSSAKQPPKSPSSRLKPSSSRGVGWSSYLQEGLTLYLDQSGRREGAMKLSYLRYDPFGRPESLVESGSAVEGAGLFPGTPKKHKVRPLSARDSDDELGIVDFGHSAYAQPGTETSQCLLFSVKEPVPILRHLGIGEDTRADLLTRQAALSLDHNGTHEVSGYERSGRIGWRFKYEVSDACDAEGHALTTHKMLRPLTFSCSATLLDPAKARKARLFKMVKKGVSSSLSSTLVQQSPGRQRSGTNRSDIQAAAALAAAASAATQSNALAHDAGPPQSNQQSSRKVSLYPGSYGTPSSEGSARRPSARTASSGGSVQRLDSGSVHIPAHLPPNVVPFRFRPSIGSQSSSDPSSTPSAASNQAASSLPDPALFPVDYRPSISAAQAPSAARYARSARSVRVVKIGNVNQAAALTRASHGDIFRSAHTNARAASSSGLPPQSSEAPTRPTTASEEIKLAYLQRSLDKEREEADAARQAYGRYSPSETEEEMSTPTQEQYSCVKPISAPTAPDYRDPRTRSVSSSARLGDVEPLGASKGNPSPPGTQTGHSFSSIKAQSRQRLRQAISTKALPDLPSVPLVSAFRKSRPVTAQNLGATGSQTSHSPGSPSDGRSKPISSASLLVELGFL
ncbi:unnamed protein product [Parajaminaea phylloscopi]